MKALSLIRDRLRSAFYRCRYDFANNTDPSELCFRSLDTLVISKIDGKLGDTEVISPFLIALKEHCPKLRLIVLTSASLAPLYREFLKADEVIVLSKRPKAPEIDKAAAQIGTCDLLLTLEQTFRSHDFYLIHKLHPKFIAGVNREIKAINIHLEKPDCHLTAWFSQLLSLGGIEESCDHYVLFAGDDDLSEVKAYCREGQIMLCPWGASRHKHLKDETVLALARMVMESTDRPLALMVPPDSFYLHELLWKELDPKRLVLIPKELGIRALAAITAVSSAVITVDTAYVHLACAAQKPLFAVYNGNNPHLNVLWGPVPSHKAAVVFSRPPLMIDELDAADLKAPTSAFLTSIQNNLPFVKLTSRFSMLKTYVISLPKSKERRDCCFKACEEAGLDPEWFEAVNGRELFAQYEKDPESFKGRIELQDPVVLDLGMGKKVSIADKLSPSELGCAMSHLKIYEEIAQGSEPYALILEDDCLLKPAVKEVLPLILDKADKWDIVQLAHDSGIRAMFDRTIILNRSKGWFLKHEGMGFLDPIFNRRRASFLAAAYIVKRSAAARLAELGFPARLPADYLTGLAAYHKQRLWTLHAMQDFVRLGEFDSTINTAGSERPKHRLS